MTILDEQKYRDTLLNAHLNTLTQAKNLKDIGYARLASVALYVSGEATLEEIADIVATQILNIQNIPSESIKGALELLQIDGKARQKGGKWQLTDEAKLDFDNQSKQSIAKENKLLEMFFPKSIDKNILKNWFKDTNGEYFSEQSDLLIKSFLENKKEVAHIDEILESTISRHSLDAQKKNLMQGYKEFLSSDDSLAEGAIWDFMQGLLSTKLVVADISPNLMSIEKYKNAKAYIDTNVLFAMALKSKGKINSSIKALGDAMNFIGVKLYITPWTKEEYSNVCTQEKSTTLKIFNAYSPKVIQETKGDFIQEALKRGYTEGSEIEDFFKEISEIPSKFGEIEIYDANEEDVVSMKIDKSSAKDNVLYKAIEAAAKRGNYSIKRNGAIVHDTVMTKFIEERRKNEACFILTLDHSMEELSLKWVNEKEEPIWVNFLTLIQILAINGAGPGFDSKQIAPLAKAFIEYQGFGKFHKYAKADLLFLVNCEEDLKKIPLTNVVSLLNKIHRKQMKGLGKKEEKELSIEIQRDLTTTKQDLKNTLAQKDEQIKHRDKKINSLEQENATLKFISYRKKQQVWLGIKIIISTVGFTALFFFLGNEVLEAFNQGNKYDALQIVLGIAMPLLSSAKSYESYKNNLKEYGNG